MAAIPDQIVHLGVSCVVKTDVAEVGMGEGTRLGVEPRRGGIREKYDLNDK